MRGGTCGAVALISALAWGLGYIRQPHILARFMAADDLATIPKARRIGMAWMILCLAGAVAVGGPTMGAIPLACAAISAPGGGDLVGFFVRGARKEHGMQRWVEGPVEAGARVLVVEDTVTSGGSTVTAIERIQAEGLEIAATVCVVDRLAGGGDAIEAASGAPFRSLLTIDDVYPERPDRGSG